MIRGKGRDRDRAVAANRIPNIWLTGAVCDSSLRGPQSEALTLNNRFALLLWSDLLVNFFFNRPPSGSPSPRHPQPLGSDKPKLVQNSRAPSGVSCLGFTFVATCLKNSFCAVAINL